MSHSANTTNRPSQLSSDDKRRLLSRLLEKKAQEKARLYIRENLIQIAPIFVKQKYMLGEEFSMLDVAIAPLLWRLDHYQIQLNKPSAPLLKYAERLFSRQAFIDSMTASEKAMRR